MDYALIWSILIALGLFIYMALDGFDLGVGILFPFRSSIKDRDNMMNSIAPIWDTNETWLVLAGGGLYGTFPKAYVFIFNALYTPLIMMLICVVFRGVSFEFRFKSKRYMQRFWDYAFFGGSVGMAFFQGIILGQIVRGFSGNNGVFNNDYWAWSHHFNFLMGGLVILYYTFMGSNFLIYRLDGKVKQWFMNVSKKLLWAIVIYVVALCVFVYATASPEAYTALSHQINRINTYWWLYLLVVCVVAALVVILNAELSRPKLQDGSPFIYGTALLAIGFFAVTFMGWPYIIPGALTIWEASSLPETQKLMFIGASVFLPLILGYSLYNFYVFRGKVSNQKFYH